MFLLQELFHPLKRREVVTTPKEAVPEVIHKESILECERPRLSIIEKNRNEVAASPQSDVTVENTHTARSAATPVSTSTASDIQRQQPQRHRRPPRRLIEEM